MARIASLFAGRVVHVFALVVVATAFALLIVVNTTALVDHDLVLFEVWNPDINYPHGMVPPQFDLEHTATASTYTHSIHPPADKCITPTIGFDLGDAVGSISVLSSGDLRSESALTNAMVLHPLATAFSFFVLVTSVLPRKFVPPVVSPILCGLATLLELIALTCNFVVFSNLKSKLANSLSNSRHYYAVGFFDKGMVIMIAAAVCLLIGSISLFARWWFGRRLKKTTHDAHDAHDAAATNGGVEQDQGKTDYSSGTLAPLYEEDLGNKAGYTELSGGAWADRHELDSQDRPVELRRQGRYYELPVTQPVSHDLEQGSGNR
ncbi:pali-domain-containing protein [Annulohypoxylon bovei var. microspora]|nr:pali-domain-containing protein [Annulohypoxylon bovei var. microspora]